MCAVGAVVDWTDIAEVAAGIAVGIVLPVLVPPQLPPYTPTPGPRMVVIDLSGFVAFAVW